MKQALKNIFAQPEVKTSWGAVVKRVSQDKVEIVDQVGRSSIVYVDAGGFYPPGASVAVLDGMVVGPAGVLGNIKRVVV